jgi:hypothetical protein
MQSMETNAWSMMVGDTKIRVIKGFIGDAGDRVDMIVVGKNQQWTLEEPKLGNLQYVGEVSFCNGHTIYKKGKDDESASDDDTYRPYKHKSTVWKRRVETLVNANMVKIIEPRIKEAYLKQGVTYSAERKNPKKESSYITYEEDNDEGIKVAAKDLAMCYEKVLGEILQALGEKKEKSVALPALSADVGFPRWQAAAIAIDAVFNFIKNNPGAYDVIELFVKKDSEFGWYKDFLAERVADK